MCLDQAAVRPNALVEMCELFVPCLSAHFVAGSAPASRPIHTLTAGLPSSSVLAALARPSHAKGGHECDQNQIPLTSGTVAPDAAPAGQSTGRSTTADKTCANCQLAPATAAFATTAGPDPVAPVATQTRPTVKVTVIGDPFTSGEGGRPGHLPDGAGSRWDER